MPRFFWLTFVFFTFFVALTSFGKCCTQKESFKIFFNETELIKIHVLYYSMFMCGIYTQKKILKSADNWYDVLLFKVTGYQRDFMVFWSKSLTAVAKELSTLMILFNAVL